MWRTHRNRVDKGLGGTFSESGFHEGMSQDTGAMLPNNYLNVFQLITGVQMKSYFNAPHLRWH